MNLKTYIYKAPDGVHFPDARVGEEKIYEIDLGPYLGHTYDSLEQAGWSADAGLEIIEEFLNVSIKLSKVKVKTPIIGSFTIICTVRSISPAGTDQITKVPMIIKVV